MTAAVAAHRQTGRGPRSSSTRGAAGRSEVTGLLALHSTLNGSRRGPTDEGVRPIVGSPVRAYDAAAKQWGPMRIDQIGRGYPGPPAARSIALALATLTCPIALSGCIIGLLPFGVPRPTAPTPAPTIAAGPSPTSQADLPDLPITDLPGAPALAVWSPDRNAQIRVSIWRSGALTDELVVPLLNRDPVYLDHVRVLFSPTGAYFVVKEAADGPTITRAFIRIFTKAGDLVWTAPRDVAALPTIRWSPDGTKIAIDAMQRWLVVTPKGAGQAQVVAIDTRRARLANDPYAFPWQLLDFSEDGATIFASRQAGLLPNTLPLAKVAATGGPLQPVASLPTKPGRRLAPARMLLDTPLERPIDPTTGRLGVETSQGVKGDTEIVIRTGKKERRFPLPDAYGADGATAWLDGSLVVLYRGLDQVEQHLVVVSTGTAPKERVVASFPVAADQRGAGLVAVTDGYTVLGFGRGLPEVRNRLLLVRLSDGAQTAIDADGLAGTIETFGFGGWLTP